MSDQEIDPSNSVEQMGSKEKYWVRLTDGHRWLLKVSRGNDHDDVISGEDWAEFAVHHLATLLGVPTARVRPATYEGNRAILSRSVLLDDESEALVHGNELLAGRDASYQPDLWGHNPRYTVTSVRAVLEGIAPPAEMAWPTGFTAFDVWASYLVLDAWVSGRDRHHENWAVVRSSDGQRLAPSFDHGNALGFQERDPKRERLLSDKEYFERWLDRGTSPHFAGRPHLVRLAHDALQRCTALAREYWLERLAAVGPDGCSAILEAAPLDIMSDVTRTFVTQLLAANRRRILNGYNIG